MKRYGRVAVVLVLTAAMGGLGASMPGFSPAQAQEMTTPEIAPRLLFALSGGAWTREAEGDASASERGYYRALAFRGPDNTVRVSLDTMRLGEDGPEIETSQPISAIDEAGLYVVGMRSDSVSGSPDFSILLEMKNAPDSPDTEIWSIVIDAFGEVTAGPASN